VQTGFEELLHSVQSQCWLQPPAAVLQPDFCQGQQPYGPQRDSTFDSTLDCTLASGTASASTLQWTHWFALIQSAPDGPHVQTGFEELLHSVQSQCMLQPPAAVLHPKFVCQGQQPYGPQLDSTFDSALDSALDSTLASGTTVAPALQWTHWFALIQSAPDGPHVQTGFEELLHSVQSQCMLQPPAAVLHPKFVCHWQHP